MGLEQLPGRIRNARELLAVHRAELPQETLGQRQHVALPLLEGHDEIASQHQADLLPVNGALVIRMAMGSGAGIRGLNRDALALDYDAASVCIMPYYLRRCAEILAGSTVNAST